MTTDLAEAYRDVSSIAGISRVLTRYGGNPAHIESCIEHSAAVDPLVSLMG